MKRWILLGLLGMAGLCGGRPVRAAEAGVRASKPQVRKELVAIVDAQLAAFRQGDATKAYGYAAASLRAAKPLRMFVAIVQSNYPEIWTNTRAEFGLARDDGAHATMLVHVFGPDGDAPYDFTLVKENAGWRIDGVLRHEPNKAEKV